MSRLIIISNRLPFSVDRDGDKVTVRQSSGGLVSAIKSYFENANEKEKTITEKLWVGVADFPQEDWRAVEKEQNERGDFEVLPLFAFNDKQLYEDYYNGFSNSVLWPLFHYFSSLAEYKTNYFEAYMKVNLFFADQLTPILHPDDIIWIHDYQLMLLPQLLRGENPELSIGFFLHIPFPSYEIFRLLPTEWKKTLLQGIMGADLIGFHTHDYVQHFIQSVKMVLGVDNYFQNLQYQERLVKVDLFPIGIDFKKFNSTKNDPVIMQMRDDLKKNFENKKIVFSVDRLDYTKGLMSRLTAIEYFLDKYPQWKEKAVFVLNVVPSRDSIKAYDDRKKEMEEKIGTINGKYSTISWQPIIYRYNHLSFNELVALYHAADAALVTPLRDGMNLVAKEYVATCSNFGVLILSELAGAASELNEALLVNPTDMADVASAINRALIMPDAEKKNRITIMQKRLQDYDVVKWVSDFLEQLAIVKREQQKFEVRVVDEKIITMLKEKYEESNKRCLLFDYDGTLAPIARIPSQAIPNKQLIDFLYGLAADENNNITIISGREADVLEKWFGEMPLTLVAEHGASIRKKGEKWRQEISGADKWKDEIRPLLKFFVSRCAGSFIEEKKHTIAWHYRNTQADLGFIRSRELMNNLTQLTQNSPLQVVDGNKVIEVRISGFDKGITALKIVNEVSPDFILCIGDDITDEDMFKALEQKPKAYTIKVGYGSTSAKYTIISQAQVLPLLNHLTEKEYAGS
ncbi:MAG TPA: bifunctional alpha,alpha-trehalose-phosphate synthase (UDP-forming)/trehalose-phosphatase [Puia sp.]|jgi:trehalose 6-phosphate synthase/phosphatase|nr:bifunctional alpha,alpha-trehalose-phosphate synthase (UDP-forming)/trehalose-phosphatase [Puia sp.]